MARKATATNYYIRHTHGQVSEVFNARAEISRGNGAYGVHWRFVEVTKEEFLKEIEKGNNVYCIKTLSNKYIEVDEDDINKYILG